MWKWYQIGRHDVERCRSLTLRGSPSEAVIGATLAAGRQFSFDINMGDVALQKQILFGESEIDETVVIGEELNVLATAHALWSACPTRGIA